MSSSVIVDVVIGIALMYLVLSLFCTAVQEWIAQILGWRQQHLDKAVRYLLDDGRGKADSSTTAKEQSTEILQHPLIKLLTTQKKTLFSSWSQRPAYIPARNFTLALIDVLKPMKNGGQIDVSALSTAITNTKNDALKVALEPIVAMAGADLGKAVAGIEAWYDSAMDRASGWYKRQVRWTLLLIGLVLGYLTNADPIQVAMHLAEDGERRAKVVALAAATAKPDAHADPALKAFSENLAKEWSEGDMLAGFGDLPVGWAVCGEAPLAWGGFAAPSCYPGKVSAAAALGYKLLGLILTALAASLGAPFWFGLLQQLNAARSSGPRPTAATTPARS